MSNVFPAFAVVLVLATLLAACGTVEPIAAKVAGRLPAPPASPAAPALPGARARIDRLPQAAAETSFGLAIHRPTDPATTRRTAALARLNAARLGAGAGPVAESPTLDRSAADHAAYLTTNGFTSTTSPHDERSGLAGYTGSDPFKRMKTAGYNFSYATEVIGEIGSGSAASDCVGDLLGTIYHAALTLSHVTDVGIGFGSGDAAGLCTIDLAAPLRNNASHVPAAGAIVAYPYAGQTVHSGTFNVDCERPRASIALLPNATAGTPVLVSLRNVDYVKAGRSSAARIERFTLSDSSGTLIPGVILASAEVTGPGVNTDLWLGAGFAVLVPTNPLPAGLYTVNLDATIAGGSALALSSWSFAVASD